MGSCDRGASFVCGITFYLISALETRGQLYGITATLWTRGLSDVAETDETRLQNRLSVLVCGGRERREPPRAGLCCC